MSTTIQFSLQQPSFIIMHTSINIGIVFRKGLSVAPNRTVISLRNFVTSLPDRSAKIFVHKHRSSFSCEGSSKKLSPSIIRFRNLSTATSTLTDPSPWLYPLTASEITRAAEAVRQKIRLETTPNDENAHLRFTSIALKEPPKQHLLSHAHLKRQALIVTIDTTTGLASEWTVDLPSTGPSDSTNGDELATVSKHVSLPAGVQPMLTPDDCFLAEEIVQKSEFVAAVIRERYGILDMATVACDPWSIHVAHPSDVAPYLANNPTVRLVQAFLYHRQYGTAQEDNHYAHPLDISVFLDLNTKKVLTIHGLERNPPPSIPSASVNYHRELVSTNSYLQQVWRSDALAALNVTQPDGPSFTVTDQHFVTWQGWTLQVGFNYREGLVLHNVCYQGRPILYRASLVEMAVPYGDPYPPHFRKCAFDVGDYGLGFCANSLELGCDCLGHIHYFDAVLSDAAGNPVVKKSAICMHEEDQGILWKHVDYRNGHNETRRSRELVLSFIATVVNYEYLFYWRLKQDGMIEYEIKLSGELSTNLLSEQEASEHGGKPTHGVLVAPGVNAQIHQHMFCARLDMAVDGHENTVSEMDVVCQPVDPKTNPYGNAFVAKETVLENELQAIRVADPTKARSWKVSNASGKVNNVNGKATAYKLVPFTKGPAHPTLLVDPSSTVAKKGAFAQANLWVTAHDDEECFPSGNHTPLSDGSDGLPSWVAKNRNLVGQDVVLWHAFGVCHVPRVEDFPVMPVEITGFTLKPDNFFDGNPAIDLPPETNAASQLAPGCCSKK